MTLNGLFRTAGLALAALAASAPAQERAGFVRTNDVWVFVGDSITHNDTYRRVVERVYRHHNPGSAARFLQAGKDGAPSTASKEQFDKAAAGPSRPTMISLMTGMNDSINSGWRQGLPLEKPLENYRKQIDAFAAAAGEAGVDAVLLSPTLTDESLGWSSMWAIEGTAAFLRRCGAAVAGVARDRKAFYIPAQEEFEAAQRAALPPQVFRADAVHPSALGQYRIAGSLIRRMAFDAPPSAGARALSEPLPELPVSVSLGKRMLASDGKEIPLTVVTETPLAVTATYTFRRKGLDEMVRKMAEWQLTGTNSLSLELPAEGPGLERGEAADLVLDLTDGKRRSLYIVDLCRVPVLPLRDSKAGGVIEGDAARPEGRKAAEWTLSLVDGKWLWLEAEVFDSQVVPEHEWPWGQDGLTVWMDYRPPERFADIGVDADVYQCMLLPYEKPFFAVALRPWQGRNIAGPAVAGGEKTPTGYKVRLLVADGKGQFHRFGKWADADLSKRDFFAFNLVLCDQDRAADGKITAAFMPYAKTQYPHDKYANTLTVVDLKGRLQADSVVHAHLFRLY